MGSELEYCATPLVVVITRKLVLTPGLTAPKELPGVSWMAASVRFQVTGKEKVSPLFKAPCGKDALLAWYVLSPVVKPLILVIGIKAWHWTWTVFVVPIVTSPKLTGPVQFNGNDTGEPMQMTLDVAVT